MSKRNAVPGAKSHPLESFLAKHSKIGIDTSVFIYQVEENPKYVKFTQRIFDWLEGPRAGAVTSTITMLELLVHPYHADDSERVDRFYALLSTYPHLHWLPLTLNVADRAASLRAQHNLKTPDAVQAVTREFLGLVHRWASATRHLSGVSFVRDFRDEGFRR